jgi:RNA polymerase primary sigma factor
LKNPAPAPWQHRHRLNYLAFMNTSDAGLNKYLQEIARFPLLTPQEEIALARKIEQGDAAARDRMIQANLRLVVTIAADYADLGLPMMDLVSEGSIGLTKAVERFDPTKGAKLSTYAAWWIKQSIKLALSKQAKMIRLPVHLVEKISKVRRLALEMSNELGREPSDDELAEEIGMSAQRVAELRNGSTRPASLESVIDEDDSTQLGEMIADEEAQTSYDSLHDQDLQQQLKGALHVLDDREKKIVFQRFGLDGGQPQTLEQLGATIGLTRERIRQLQTRALDKLRRALTRESRAIDFNFAVAA